MTRPDDLSDAEKRQRRQEIYEKVIGYVDYNSGNTQQPPLASKTSVVSAVTFCGYTPKEVRNVIRAAQRHGDLFIGQEENGKYWLGIDDPDALESKIETYTENVRPEEQNDSAVELAVQCVRNRRNTV